jgi:CDP-6-deoxy-D-xylo-4-hexulose-3-dehydrase
MISAEKNLQQIIRQEIAKLVDDYAKLEFTQKKFEPDLHSVPPSGKLIDASEMKLMVEAALDGWLTTGRFNEQFEKKLAAFLGVKKLITVNS